MELSPTTLKLRSIELEKRFKEASRVGDMDEMHLAIGLMTDLKERQYGRTTTPTPPHTE